MRSIIIILGVLLLSANTPVQDHIEYDNRMLEKTLKKADLPFEQWKELEINSPAVQEHELRGKFFTYPDGVQAGEYAYLYVGRVFSCRAGGCSAAGPADNEDISGEYFDYFMLFDAQATIQEIRVFNYQATHGHEVSARGWLKQFIGHRSPEKLEVEKNIDAISGATISVYALTHDVDLMTELLGGLVEKSEK